MKIVVIGGTGLIGTKLVNNLRQRGHEVLAASPKSGVNTFTGEGLAEAQQGREMELRDSVSAPSALNRARCAHRTNSRWREFGRTCIHERTRSSSPNTSQIVFVSVIKASPANLKPSIDRFAACSSPAPQASVTSTGM
jgi:transposase